MTYLKWFGLGYLCILLLSFGYSYAKASQTKDEPISHNWSTTRRDSASLAPDPAKFRDTAIVEIYTAPTYGWRGLFAVHPWIIFKRAGETSYTRYDVIGWGRDDVVRQNYAIPDGYWFGSKPKILVDHRGPAAEAMIPKIEAAIKSYPFRIPTTRGQARTATPLWRILVATCQSWRWICRRMPSGKTIDLSRIRLVCRRRERAFRFRCSGF